MAIRILDVGECGFDGPRMAELWRSELGAHVDRVDTGGQAARKLKAGEYHIVLINRILASDGSSGLDVIRELKDAGTTVPLMLVSDLSEAQQEAVKLGAVQGFGKSDLGEQSTLDLVKRAAGGV